MTNYVIDPQIFYWINVLGILQTVSAVFGGACVVAFFGLVAGWIYNSCEIKHGYDYNLVYLKACRRWAIVAGIIGFVFVTASIFVPGRTTSIEMIIAKATTFDNVNWTVQQVKDVVDYIVQAIKGI